MPPVPPTGDAPPPIPFASSRQSLVDLLRELAQHALTYLRDLAKMAAAEAGEKGRYVRILAVSLALAGAFGALGFFFLTVALVSAIAYGLNSWGWASFIVGVAYCIVAMLVALPAMHSITKGALGFQRTVHRVKEDAKWVKDKLAA
ncbi:MAG: phage holin family protein [Terriglobales bacterium]